MGARNNPMRGPNMDNSQIAQLPRAELLQLIGDVRRAAEERLPSWPCYYVVARDKGCPPEAARAIEDHLRNS